MTGRQKLQAKELKALQAVISYLWYDKEDDFYLQFHMQDTHIYENLRVLKEYLDDQTR